MFHVGVEVVVTGPSMSGYDDGIGRVVTVDGRRHRADGTITYQVFWHDKQGRWDGWYPEESLSSTDRMLPAARDPVSVERWLAD